MIGESFVKTNFVGKDGFRWWVGQIAPANVQGEQLSPKKGVKSWGNRLKVRIMGYHPFAKADLSDEDLPWANVMLPVTAGTGGAKFSSSIALRPGDVVIGFFLDGDIAQQPVILGAFGRTGDVPQDLPSESLGFLPFTGYTDKIPPPDGTLDSMEENDKNTESDKTVVFLDQETVDKKNENKKDDEKLDISASTVLGGFSVPADTCADNFVGNVSASLDNLLKGVKEGTDFFSDVASVTKEIQNLSNGAVSAMTESVYSSMIPTIQGGLESLYNDTFSKVLATTQNSGLAKLAGIDAQKAQVGKIASLQNNLDCLPGKIVSGLDKTIRGMIEQAVFEVVDTGTCVTEQLVGSLLNGITDDISDALDAPLKGLSDVIPKSFKVQDVLRSSSDVFKSVGEVLSCNQSSGKCVGQIKKFSIGYGPQRSFDLKDSYDNVLKNMNIADTLGADSGPITKPDCATKTFCGSPVVNFFGGDGIGGIGKVILGDIVDNVEGLSDVTADVSRTASIIGVEITDPGGAYFSSPPVISFEDPCRQGYGAVGRAIVDFNPNSDTYGQITGVDIISEGENYPSSTTDEVINSDDIPVGVINTKVTTGGSGYGDDTTASDGNVNYNLVIDNGKIISATPINNVKITIIPRIVVSSSTGVGALIKPIIGRLPLTPQGEVVQVIDCVGPETNNLVGYVNGKPYYGPYHLHPTKGVKMVGIAHTSTPHEIIYDTPEQSFAPVAVSVATTTIQESSSQPTITPTSPMTNNTSSPSTPPSSPPPSSPPPSSPPSGGGGYGGGY
tara:strand:+ start:2901 stop:5252 length:2352 start_codon:yes stop_codon:yes gene_type:complete